MTERIPNLNNEGVNNSSESGENLDRLDELIDETITKLETAGLNMEKWRQEYDALDPDDEYGFRGFYHKLEDFRKLRNDALISFEFDIDMTAKEMERIRQFDQEVRNSFKDHSNFLGNGATAEVYGLNSNETICVKFITNQERYNENNYLRVEHDYLDKVYKATREGVVKTPQPIFLRMHPSEGHSYGMEKIKGASLSQILETPEKYAELIEVAHGVDRHDFETGLQTFIERMHKAGVTHGDMFKRNLMIDRDGRLYVIDFGKAKTIDFENGEDERRQSDLRTAQHSLKDFFSKLDELTN